jgi:hypothetical protein
MTWDDVNEKFNRVYEGSENRQLQVLPGRINASGKLSAIVVVSEYRDEGAGSRQFVTPVGALLGANLVAADGLSVTQVGEDLFEELLMKLRSPAYAVQFYATKSGRTIVVLKPHDSDSRSVRPILMLPWWDTEKRFQAKSATETG